jgi:hypothetical protein
MDIESKITTLAILAAASCAAREAQRKATVCLSDVSLARSHHRWSVLYRLVGRS